MSGKRKKTVGVVALFVLLAVLAVPSLAQAGGWGVTTLDTLPHGLVAGEPYVLGMTVLQHGKTAWEAESLSIRARMVTGGETLMFSATPQGKAGHYQAELLFPAPGQWEWSVSTGLFPEAQVMPVLDVAQAGSATGGAVAGSSSLRGPALGALILLALGGGALLLARKRMRRASFGVGLGVIILGAGLVVAFMINSNAVNAQIAPTAGAQSGGAQLFLAKGCVVCHVNTRAIAASDQLSIDVGPNLSAYRNDADFLRRVLADPQAVDANRTMPNLHLEQAEIEALVAFLNEDGE